VGYEFKLEALRRYRQFQEDELQREMAAALERKDHAVAVVEAYQTRLAHAESDLYRLQSGATEISQLAIYQRFIQRIGDDIAAQKIEVEKIETECQAIRTNLLEAMQKRKTLERLKEKGLHAYLDDLSREEEKFINEMAINRFNLKGMH
jgi:flagellar protein FliJ